MGDRVSRGVDAQLDSMRVLKSSVQSIKPTVLVVEDDEFQRTTLKQLLKGADQEIVLAPGAREAFAILRERRPDVVLLDIELPDIDGRQILASLKTKGNPLVDVPVIMITGHGEKEVVTECIRAGAVDFVVKPFSKEITLTKLRKALQSST